MDRWKFSFQEFFQKITKKSWKILMCTCVKNPKTKIFPIFSKFNNYRGIIFYNIFYNNILINLFIMMGKFRWLKKIGRKIFKRNFLGKIFFLVKIFDKTIATSYFLRKFPIFRPKYLFFHQNLDIW